MPDSYSVGGLVWVRTVHPCECPLWWNSAAICVQNITGLLTLVKTVSSHIGSGNTFKRSGVCSRHHCLFFLGTQLLVAVSSYWLLSCHSVLLSVALIGEVAPLRFNCVLYHLEGLPWWVALYCPPGRKEVWTWRVCLHLFAKSST